MARPALPRPTDAELEILQVLWQHGPRTVRQVLDELNRRPRRAAAGYTSVLKLLQIMTDKGLVVRDESQRTHVYAARESQHETQKLLVKDLLRRAFDGSAARLVMQALAAGETTAQEVAHIRKLLDRHARKGGTDHDDADAE